MKFKNAWKCKKCPERNDENGCPAWWEMVLTNDVTNEQKIERTCGFLLMPQFFSMVCKDTAHSIAASYDMRNKVINNTGKVIRAINDKMDLGFVEDELIEMENPEELRQIEEKQE